MTWATGSDFAWAARSDFTSAECVFREGLGQVCPPSISLTARRQFHWPVERCCCACPSASRRGKQDAKAACQRPPGAGAIWTPGSCSKGCRGRPRAVPCRRFWPMCCLMRWTRKWSAVAHAFVGYAVDPNVYVHSRKASAAHESPAEKQGLPTAAPDDHRDQERGGEHLWSLLPGLERLGRSYQGSSDAVSPTGPSGPSEIASGSFPRWSGGRRAQGRDRCASSLCSWLERLGSVWGVFRPFGIGRKRRKTPQC